MQYTNLIFEVIVILLPTSSNVDCGIHIVGLQWFGLGIEFRTKNSSARIKNNPRL